jgi:hypothetical protein
MTMLDTNTEAFKKIKSLFNESRIDESCEDLRNAFKHKGEYFSFCYFIIWHYFAYEQR